MESLKEVLSFYEPKKLASWWSQLNGFERPSDFPLLAGTFDTAKVLYLIMEMITFKECLRDWNTVYRKTMTDEQFEAWGRLEQMVITIISYSLTVCALGYIVGYIQGEKNGRKSR